MEYDLELDKVVNEIKNSKAKKVLVQLPDGLKPKAKDIQKYIEENTECVVMFWCGSCYGACDLPNYKDADLLVHFGHNEYVK